MKGAERKPAAKTAQSLESGAKARRERLKSALRENLRRRKAQSRARRESPGGK